jgi:hypothetical protein
MSVYVEIVVRAPLDVLWAHTQTPALHARWDLRFSDIAYLPKQHEADAQRFRYTTRIGLGLAISGDGETVARPNLDGGRRSSSLKFGSAHPLSIIREGSGYWKYVPTATGIRFFTWYDYRARFGRAGALFDRWVFRPLIGWATAWSFDRLRLWLEAGVDPASAARHALVHAVSRLSLAAIFVYQGLVPKLLYRDASEIMLLGAAGVLPGVLNGVLVALGVAELALAAALAIGWTRRWPALLVAASMPLAAAVVALTAPGGFAAAFNPFSLSLAVAALAAIDLVVLDGVPSAARCRRRASREES